MCHQIIKHIFFLSNCILFLPSAKPHGQQVAFGVRDDDDEGDFKNIIFNMWFMGFEMTLTLK